ncbi:MULTISPECIES: acyl-CoA thioesterase [Vreelandella]|uniref:Thioesterase n=2 Tax=Vreelandella TaxID=3137766 RepID=A0A7C9JT74_9GAMM|nr:MULTISPECIES: thioesterase family protein [Halomonas]NDL71040.1 thioesterase [Halomonas alkaliphila]NYS46442.1 thioesterase family protein [Halomonas zhaodongensis]
MERVTLDFPTTAIIHRHSLTVRVTDMNYGRHLGHDALISLLHEARVHAFAALGLPEWDMKGYPSIVADLAVQYQHEARWPDALTIETAVPEPEGKALTIYQRICNAETDKVVATARVNQLLVDLTSGRPVSIPDKVKLAIAQARGA